MEDLSASSLIASSLAAGGGGVASPDESLLAPDPSPQIGSARGSYQNEGLLSAVVSGGAGDDGNAGGGSSDAEFGFQRPDFRQEPLAGTVQMYERHLFLCYKDPQVWPSNVEAAEFDRLPRLLSAAIKARKADIKKQVCSFFNFFFFWLV